MSYFDFSLSSTQVDGGAPALLEISFSFVHVSMKVGPSDFSMVYHVSCCYHNGIRLKYIDFLLRIFVGNVLLHPCRL